MGHRECDAEPLAIQRPHLEPLGERLRLRHHREIELALKEELRQPPGDTLNKRHIAARMCGAELGEKAHEADRSDRTHHAEVDRCVVHMKELPR